MEKVKLAILVQAETAMRDLVYERLPIEYADEYIKFCNVAFEKVRLFKEKNNELVTQKYGIQTENGWEIKPELRAEFDAEMTPVLEEEYEIEVPHFSIAKIKGIVPDFAISTITLANLKNFILYE